MTSETNSKGSGRGKEQQTGWDVRPETDGREEAGGTGQYDLGVRQPGESF